MTVSITSTVEKGPVHLGIKLEGEDFYRVCDIIKRLLEDSTAKQILGMTSSQIIDTISRVITQKMKQDDCFRMTDDIEEERFVPKSAS